jgi:hypothetical protein
MNGTLGALLRAAFDRSTAPDPAWDQIMPGVASDPVLAGLGGGERHHSDTADPLVEDLERRVAATRS